MFSKVGTYQAAGLFTHAHMISVIVCLVCIMLLVCITRKMKSQTYFKVLRAVAIIVTILEVFKIAWTWTENRFALTSWFPLYFCSLFIYASWMSLSKNKQLKELGLSYISLASIAAGVIFIFFPTTSFTWYPLFHFKCIHSMVYHSIMVYMGIMLYVTKAYSPNIKSVFTYCLFCFIFMTVAEITNILFDSNLMFIANPSNIPISFLFNIYDFSKVLYSATIIIAHLLLGFAVFGIVKLVNLIKSKLSKKIELEDLEEKTI